VAKVRAYKIAEELGLDKQELLVKAAEIGIQLRSALVGVDEEQAETLRRRLGGATTQPREEKRIGTSVIRRRRKKEAAPPPTPELAGEDSSAEMPPSVAAPEAEPSVEPLAADAAPTGEAVAEPQAPGPETPVAAEKGKSITDDGWTTKLPTPTEARPAAPPVKKLARRKVLEGVAIKEQDQLSRSMRGNVQRRLEQRRLIVEQQSRLSSARRRPTTARSSPPPAPGAPRKKRVRLSGSITFPELSGQTGTKLRDLMRSARALGAELDRDSLIDIETVQLMAEDLGFEVQRVDKNIEEIVEAAARSQPEDLEPRPPVVTVMGHVDHGKTTLLDTIRKTNVVGDEAGGITQHIGAYQARAGSGLITFIDTPGHAAFTAMRARGAQVTDIAVIVVAADDGIMPQTVEAIDHARAAGVPLIVAINKIDKPDANVQRTKQALLEHEVVPEDFGGDTICVELSAKEGTNVDKLLEMLILQAEVLELRARAKGPARGMVIEAELDRGRGPVATVLMREGMIRRGDALVVGTTCGRLRTLTNDQGATLKEAPPSTPVRIVGLSGVPEAGEELVVVKSEREAKEIVEHRIAERRRVATETAVVPDPEEDIFATLGDDEEKELRLVIKADVRGTMEATCDAVGKLASEKVKINVIHSGVGAISESDVMLASASQAIVIGFHIRPEPVARKAAEREQVPIRTFDVVYELLEDVEALAKGLLPPTLVEHISGHAEVRQLFVIPRVGTVVGCFVPDGKIRRNDMVRVVRDGVPVYSGNLASLRRFKDDVREVQAGMECGMRIENFNDVKVGDRLEAFTIEEVR
jgi:translation initiation factor IF-2